METSGPRLADIMAGRWPALALSGAGISTASGIPDYREPTGRRRHGDPMTFDRFRDSEAARRRYWARSHLGWPVIAAAKPNAAHRAVAALERKGLLVGVVTQNVDGLHTAAGSRSVIDLHGRLDAVVCLGCGVRRPRVEIGLRLDAVNPGYREAVAAVDGGMRPDGDVVVPEHVVEDFRVVDCRRCGGLLKPDVVFFGEHVPRERFRAALDLVRTARSLLVLGSSLMVGSGYRFVTEARRRDVPVVIVNRGVTRGDAHAAVMVPGDLTVLLPDLVAAVTPRVGSASR
jgi:NAD-dependent SIR2 family protein deacetylase